MGIDRVVLVENGVDTETSRHFESLASNDKRLTRLCLSKNRGSAGGFGAGFEFILETTCEGYLLVLDDDNLPGIKMLDVMADLHLNLKKRDPNQHIVLYGFRGDEFRGDRHAVDLYGRKEFQVDNFLGFSIRESLRRRALKLLGRRKETQNLIECDHGPWGGMFTSIETIRFGPKPNPDFYLYGEDTHYSLTLSKMGAKLYLVPAVKISDLTSTFNESSTLFSRRLSSLRVFYSCRNTIYNSVSNRRNRLEYALNKYTFLFYQVCIELFLNRGQISDLSRRWIVIRKAIHDGENLALGEHDSEFLSGADDV